MMFFALAPLRSVILMYNSNLYGIFFAQYQRVTSYLNTKLIL